MKKSMYFLLQALNSNIAQRAIKTDPGGITFWGKPLQAKTKSTFITLQATVAGFLSHSV